MESLRIGIRVADVGGSLTFYKGLGFEEVGVIPGPQGETVMAILSWRGAVLILDALVGMPFPDSERERLTQCSPRGLGVAIGMAVDDLDAVYGYCVAHGCQVTSQPEDEPWGDRVFECVDPNGYVWEFSMKLADVALDKALSDTAASWFENDNTD